MVLYVKEVNMKTEIEIKRELLKTLIKQVEKRIKEVQLEKKYCYTQEDVWVNQGIENELIRWKISLEIQRKNVKLES